MLFSYGPHPVTRQEFLKAYTKNNTDSLPGEASLRNYLELYVRFKLKVRAALDLRMDTLPGQRDELNNFRNQISERYLNDEETLNRLVEEAMQRAQKDVHLAHIFISVPPGATPDELARGREKASAVYERLRGGADFAEQAVAFSDDPRAQSNHGDLGYITVFLLPYELESIVYATAVGAVSPPYQSAGGFHIFKNLGERPAVGQVQVAQVLVALSPGADAEERALKRQLADSLYQLLRQGADFSDIALRYSSDNLTYRSGGALATFGVGRYQPAFEEAAFALTADSALSPPVETEFGYHILRRLGRTPVQADPALPAHRDAFLQEVINDERVDLARSALLKKVLRQIGYKKSAYDSVAFARVTDTILQSQQEAPMPRITSSMPLFSFNGKTFSLRDWANYLGTFRGVDNFRAGKSNAQLLDQYAESAALDYYREHLEQYQPQFADQVKEFQEGNLLFEVMQQKIWDVASADSAGLHKYYTTHAPKYWWEPSADVVILTANSAAIAESVTSALKADPNSWHTLGDNYPGSVQADSGRYELSQLPMEADAAVAPGVVTAPLKNESENQYLFCLILKVYPDKELRSFNDARGYVINDYQNELENRWITALKRKYPVRVNEAVFKTLLK